MQVRPVLRSLSFCNILRRYVLYEGEGHGFVKESSVVDSVQQELLFYGDALGFTPAL